MAANLVGGHVGRCLRAEGGREREERRVRCTGECGFDLNVGKTASTFPMSCSYTALRELRATNKINSY